MEKSNGEIRKKSRVWSSIPTIVLTNEGKEFMAKHCTVLATFPKSKIFFLALPVSASLLAWGSLIPESHR